MDRATEIALIEELLGLNDQGLAYLDETVTFSPLERYNDADRFAAERAMFRRTPLIVAHSSELPEPAAFLRRDIAGLPGLLTRDREGQLHAFLNVCRHRGARLVEEESGCKNTFSCPYHAWTWTNQGDLRGVPQQKQGFPGLDRKTNALVRFPAEERHGWIWVLPDRDGTIDLDTFLAPIAKDLDWVDAANMRIAHSDVVDCKSNWKTLIEGGIEAYHFRVAHANTIGPHFPDNLSSYQMMGDHMRSFLPKMELFDADRKKPDSWNIRDLGNIIYSIFPTNQILLMEDHFAWIAMNPVSHDRTLLRLSTVVPKSSDEPEKHWLRNHKITKTTLMEDFVIGEAVQEGFVSGANTHHTLGRFEGALTAFNAVVERHL